MLLRLKLFAVLWLDLAVAFPARTFFLLRLGSQSKSINLCKTYYKSYDKLASGHFNYLFCHIGIGGVCVWLLLLLLLS